MQSAGCLERQRVVALPLAPPAQLDSRSQPPCLSRPRRRPPRSHCCTHMAVGGEAELCRPQAILVLATHAAIHKGKVGVFPLLATRNQ